MEAAKDYIFISYSRDDLPKVRPIVEEMRNGGYNVWHDTKILPGEDWTDYIASHIANCAVCVAFHSQTSRDSPHCREEIHYALKHGKTVISVYLADVTLKEGLDMQLARFQSVKYAEPAELLETLRQSPDFARCRFDAPQKRKGVNVKAALKKAKQRILAGWKFFFHKVLCPLGGILLLVAIVAALVIYLRRKPLWYLNESGVLDIVSPPLLEVKMPDYSYNPGEHLHPPPWGTKTLNVKCAVIRKGVTHVGDSSFQNCSTMRVVFISEGVTSIGHSAFYHCAVLQRVYLPSSLELLGWYAFYDCTNLKEINIPLRIKELPPYVFYGCTALERVYVTSGVTSIAYYAFVNCTALKQVQFSKGIQTIGDWAFANCTALEEIAIPDSIRLIGGGAFSGCSKLKTVHIRFNPERVQIVDRIPYGSSADPDTLYIHARAFDPDTEIIYDPPVSDANVSDSD